MAIGTPVCIGTKNNSEANVNDIVTGAAVPSGALVILTVILYDGGSSSISLNSTGGLTWTADAEMSVGSGYRLYIFSAPAPSGLASSTTISVFQSDPYGVNMTLLYVEGVDTSGSRVDTNTTLNDDANSDIWSTGSATTTNADTILIAPAMGDGGTSAMATDSPATELSGSEQYDATNEWRSSVSYRIVSSTGTYTLSGTFTGIADWGGPAAWIAYKAASGGTDTISMGLVTETETAQAMAMQETVALGLNTETDTAQSIALQETVALGLVTETDTAQAMSMQETVVLGLATETDEAQSIATAEVVALGLASETDDALPLTLTETVVLGLAEETDEALSVGVTDLGAPVSNSHNLPLTYAGDS